MVDSGWLRTTVGALCDEGVLHTQTGPFGSQLHSYDYVPSGVPVVPTEGIGRRRLLTEGIPEVSEETAARLSRHRLQRGDILFARRGLQATGLSAIVTLKEEGWLCGTGAILLRSTNSKIDPEFLSFFLSSDESIRWLKQHAVGAVMPNLNEGVIRNLPLTLPPLTEQKAIAAVLGALDDKIELNRRMNATLEAMSRALFQRWFVDYSTIPEGWRKGTLGEVATNPRRGVIPDKIDPSTVYIGLEHMPRRCIALYDWGCAEELESNKFQFLRGEILFGKLRPYFHKVGVAPIDGICSTDILVVSPLTRAWFGFVLGHISSIEFINHTNAVSGGTKMPRTSWHDMARYEVALPPESLSEEFSALIRPAIERIIANIHESRTLAALRNTLLPKLLSGELRP